MEKRIYYHVQTPKNGFWYTEKYFDSLDKALKIADSMAGPVRVNEFIMDENGMPSSMTEVFLKEKGKHEQSKNV